MWGKKYWSPSYWAMVFWGPVVAQDNSGAISGHRYELHNNNEMARIVQTQRHGLENTNQRAQ